MIGDIRAQSVMRRCTESGDWALWDEFLVHIGYHYRIEPASDVGPCAPSYRWNLQHAGDTPNVLLIRDHAALDVWQRSLDQGNFNLWNEYLAELGYQTRIEPRLQVEPRRGQRSSSRARCRRCRSRAISRGARSAR